MAKLPHVILANPRKQKSTKITYLDSQKQFLIVKLNYRVKKLKRHFLQLDYKELTLVAGCLTSSDMFLNLLNLLKHDIWLSKLKLTLS